MSKILEIKGLSAGYGSLRVIHDLDLIIETGERVGIVGLNGCLLYTSPSPRD